MTQSTDPYADDYVAPTTMTPDQIVANASAGSNTAVSSYSSYSPGGQVPPDGNIYLGQGIPGYTQFTTKGPYAAGMNQGGGTTNIVPYGEARLLPSIWANSDPNQLKKLVNTGIMNHVPGFSAGMGLPEITNAWDKLISASFDMNQTSNPGSKHWTPWDVLATYGNSGKFGTVKVGDWLYDAATNQRISYVGPKSKTTTSSNVNLSSSEDVKALTTQVLTQALGRAPTPQEVAQYKSTINAAESSNPQLTTTTSTYDDQGNVSNQSSKTSGGMTSAAEQQMIQDQASQTPEFAKYQSGTTYFNALMGMLTGG